MPRGDGTGPMGRGPLTGRRAGFCAGYQTPGYANPEVPGMGMGRGRRRGFRRGYGRGFGLRYGRFYGPDPDYDPYYDRYNDPYYDPYYGPPRQMFWRRW
jgi:hypothetical protein